MTPEQILFARAMEAMATAYKRANPFHTLEDHDVALTAAFDALHGIVRAVPLEATDEMKQAALRSDDYGTRETMFRDMAAAGDLTKKPEKKP